jgi:hypothetical protein
LREELGSAAAITLLLLAIYGLPVAFNVLTGKHTFIPVTGVDTVPTALLPAALLKDGGFYLDSYRSYIAYRWGEHAYFVRMAGGHLVSVYPVATAVLATPVYLLPVWAGWAGWVGSPEETFYVARVAAATLTAIAMGLFYLTCRASMVPWKATALTLAMALGTSNWTTASQGLWQHTGSVLLLCGALVFLVRGEHDERLVPWSGLLLSASTVARYNNATTAAVLTLYVLVHHRRQVAAFAALATMPLIALAAYNTAIFGSPLAMGYGEAATGGWSEVWWQGLLGLLFSPAKGLFVFSPFLMLALPEGVRALLKPRPLSLRFCVAVACAVFALIMGVWWGWYGGVSYGNRMLTDAMPLWGLLLVPVCNRFSRIGWTAFGVLAAVAAAVQSLGLLDYGAFWHRVYDTPTYWDTWIWDVQRSPIPFYVFRYWHRLFHGAGAGG